MKITFGRLFDQALIGKERDAQVLQPFIDWTQQAVDNIARALTSALTIGDNMDANFYTQKAKGAATAVTLEFRVNKTPKALLLAQQSPISPTVSYFAWQMLPSGNCQVNLQFVTAPTAGVDVVFVAFNA